MLAGKPLFPGKSVVHELDLITDLLGTPPAESIAKVSISDFVFILFHILDFGPDFTLT